MAVSPEETRTETKFSLGSRSIRVIIRSVACLYTIKLVNLHVSVIGFRNIFDMSSNVSGSKRFENTYRTIVGSRTASKGGGGEVLQMKKSNNKRII